MRNLANEEPARMQKMEQRLSQRELSMPRSVAQSTLLTNRQRSALSSLEYAAILQPRRSVPRLKSESMRNPCSNRPEAERHTIPDNSAARKQTKQIICPAKYPPSIFPSHPSRTPRNVGRVMSARRRFFGQECPTLLGPTLH